MKRKVLSVLLALSMILAMVPVMSMANTGGVQLTVIDVTGITDGKVAANGEVAFKVTAAGITLAANETTSPAIKITDNTEPTKTVEYTNETVENTSIVIPNFSGATTSESAIKIPASALTAGHKYTVTASWNGTAATGETIEFTVEEATDDSIVTEPIAVTVTITTTKVTTGSAVSAVKYTVKGTDGTEVEGTLTWYVSAKDRTEVTNFQSEVGKQTLAYIFVSSDEAYSNCEGTFEFDVVANDSGSVDDGSDSPGSTGGGGSDSTPAADNTVGAETSVEGDTVVVEAIDEEELEDIAGDAANASIVLDLSDAEGVTQAEIPAEVIEAIQEVIADDTNNIASVEIVLPDGSIELDEAALEEIIEQAGGGSITITVANVGKEALNDAQAEAAVGLGVQGVFEIGIAVEGDVDITDLAGGTATVRVPWTFEDGLKAAGFMVKHVDINGILENMPTLASIAEKYMSWTTGHFSTYLVTYSEDNIVCDGSEGCPSAIFSDVDSGKWYHLAIDYVVENGLMEGMGDGIFGPELELTRAELVQILYNAEGKPAVTGTAITFSDVAADKWYADAIAWASANGVVTGYEDGTFAPNKEITREELVTVLYRNAGSPAASGDLSGFIDGAQVQGYAVDAMIWATSNGIIKGQGNNDIAPQENAERAEVAQIFMNMG